MTTADTETRIADLKARWEADPSSRIFVQLADEYRRAGNTAEAIEVLTKGLAAQPNYVTAQAALGRCYLAAGDPGSAIEVLSRVMEQDPSHPLAGKLLVEAHLQTGDLDGATKRLEHYRMVADSGPELEALEERLAAARREQSAEVQPTATASDAVPPGDGVGGADSDDVFDLGSVELSIPDSEPVSEPASDSASVPESDPFDLATPPEAPTAPAAAATSEDPFQLDPPPQAPAPAQGSSAGQDEPFGDLLAGSDLGRWSQDLDREGIFQLDAPRGSTAEPGDSKPEGSVVAPGDFAPEEPARDEFALDEAEPDEAESIEAEFDGEGGSEEATVTLGQLYRAQGHRQEAARIFRSVLEKDPNNEVSLRALAELEGVGTQEPPPEAPPEPEPQQPQPEEEPAVPSMSDRAVESAEPPEAMQAAELREDAPREAVPPEPVPQDEAPQEDAQAVVAAPVAAKGITERKISALEDYLHRLRQAARS